MTALLKAAVACDSQALTARTVKDKSILSFGNETPAHLWRVPDDSHRYAALVLLLTKFSPQRQQLGESETEFVWPRAESEVGFASDAAWSEMVDNGLISAAEAKRMRTSGYTTWRLHITASGRVSAFVTGS